MQKMSVLQAFLHPIFVEETKEVVISKRFVGEDGKPAPFVIRTITQEQNNKLMKANTRAKVVNGQRVEIFDNAGYTNSLILACTVQPDFEDEEMCKAYGCVDPKSVPEKMLYGGEYSTLAQEILQFNGFDADRKVRDEEEAKNS